MNQTEHILLQAIQKSLWETDIAFPEDTDWDAVLKEAQAQAVLGIAIAVAPEEIQSQWKAKTAMETSHYVRVLYAEQELVELFEKEGISLTILKGTAAAIYYPVPSRRSMGDIDFIVPLDQIERAKVLLEQNQYVLEDDPRSSRHIHVSKNKVLYEMHRFFNTDIHVDVDPFISAGLLSTESGIVDGVHFPMLPKITNGLVLLAHIAQHLKTALGLRQVIDWMMYVDKELDDEAWAGSFQEAARKVGLETLALTVTKMCQDHLGLSTRITWCKDADEALCDALLDSVLSSGNFGRKRGSGASIETVVTNLKRKGFTYLQQAGEYHWQAYRKYKWLKPFAWVYQIGRYAKRGLKTGRNRKQIENDIARGNQRSDLFRKLEIGKGK